VEQILHKVEEVSGESFNSVHLNLYRDGRDHVSWHTDEDVPLYGPSPCIASVSFGAERAFLMRRMTGEPYEDDWKPESPSHVHRFVLGDGALLVMRGATQRHWEHCVQKESDLGGQRINLTFRRVTREQETVNEPDSREALPRVKEATVGEGRARERGPSASPSPAEIAALPDASEQDEQEERETIDADRAGVDRNSNSRGRHSERAPLATC